VPDWICEVLSLSTRGYDLVTKRNFYAEIGVQHLWYVDPEARVLIVSRLDGGRWLEIGAYRNNARVRAEPFEAVELELESWWEGIEEASEEDG
jgi:Uma2 family endonuclease